MATKADRGNKHVCQNCRSKFYDLNRTPIICPICHTPLEIRTPAPKPAFAAGKGSPIDEDQALAAGSLGADFVPLEDVDDASGLGDLDADDVADIGDDAADIDPGDDEAFLEDDDETDPDVSGFVGGGVQPDDET